MAFDRDNFAKISSGYAHIVSPQMFSYLSPVDDITAMLVSGYFDEVNQETDITRIGDLFLLDPPATHATLVTVLSLNPVVLGPAIEASGLADGSVTTPKLANFAVTNIKLGDAAVITVKIDSNAVTTDKLAGFAVTTAKIDSDAVTNIQLADNAVRTAKIQDANVTKAKLATNIQPFSVSVHQSHVTTLGGAALEIFAVSGILASDFVFATMESPGASSPVIVDSFGQANAIHVRFSVDPSSDTLILLNAFRAT